MGAVLQRLTYDKMVAAENNGNANSEETRRPRLNLRGKKNMERRRGQEETQQLTYQAENDEKQEPPVEASVPRLAA